MIKLPVSVKDDTYMDWLLDADGNPIAECETSQIAAALVALINSAGRMKNTLERLRDCDWVISRGDRMDAVRKLAREGLGELAQEPGA